jgi:PTS system ascorbate-specific IIA component
MQRKWKHNAQTLVFPLSAIETPYSKNGKVELVMLIKDILKPENVQIIDSVKNWEDAVYRGTDALIRQGSITADYPKAIIKNVNEHGAYFVLCPYVALLHATTSDGVLETQLALTLVNKPFYFEGKDEPVRLMITLAAADSKTHIGAMQQIGSMLMEPETIDEIMAITDADHLYQKFAYFESPDTEKEKNQK